jgi:hypothetical protein
MSVVVGVGTGVGLGVGTGIDAIVAVGTGVPVTLSHFLKGPRDPKTLHNASWLYRGQPVPSEKSPTPVDLEVLRLLLIFGPS